MGVLVSVAVGTAGDVVVIWAAGLLVGEDIGFWVGDGNVMGLVWFAHADIEKTSRAKQRGTN
jgi:hypothetical protein